MERKIELVSRPPTEEVLTKDELRSLFETNDRPRHYIGFEISGKIHVGSGVMTALKIKDFLEAGVRPTIFLADFHTWINNKLGGDLEKIREVARGYFTAGFVSLGLPEDKVDYVLASELYDLGYWSDVIRISKATTLARMQRCMVIMGRTEGEAVESASMLYPAMQAADVFRQDLDIVQKFARHCNAIARKLEEDEETGSKRYIYVRLKREDHFRLANCYEAMARHNAPRFLFPEARGLKPMEGK